MIDEYHLEYIGDRFTKKEYRNKRCKEVLNDNGVPYWNKESILIEFENGNRLIVPKQQVIDIYDYLLT